MLSGRTQKQAGPPPCATSASACGFYKLERIAREEMERAGALEVLMPAVQPAEVWQGSERWFE